MIFFIEKSFGVSHAGAAGTKSIMSGASNKHNTQQVGFADTKYDAPTLKRLNPELYKEMAKQAKQVQDPIFTSVQHLKERYSYHEMRVQRI